jgi:mannose-6-phosphate isomerase-like protein (cupin superfamily)
MTFQDRAIVLRPGEGKTVTVFGDRHTYKAVGEQTGEAFGLVEIAMPAPAAGPPAHVHRGVDEAFYVLAGELTMLIGDRTITATAGSFAFVPRGTVHAFANRGTREARFLGITSPAGSELGLEEVAEFASSADQPPDMGRLLAIAEKYHVEIVGPPLA